MSDSSPIGSSSRAATKPSPAPADRRRPEGRIANGPDGGALQPQRSEMMAVIQLLEPATNQVRDVCHIPRAMPRQWLDGRAELGRDSAVCPQQFGDTHPPSGTLCCVARCLRSSVTVRALDRPGGDGDVGARHVSHRSLTWIENCRVGSTSDCGGLGFSPHADVAREVPRGLERRSKNRTFPSDLFAKRVKHQPRGFGIR